MCLEENQGEIMIRHLLAIAILLTLVNGEEMPIMAKPGQCFTKAFFPPKELKTIRTTSTKKVIIRKSTLKYEVIPAKYKWYEKRVKISDGTEKTCSHCSISYIHSHIRSRLNTAIKSFWRI